MLQRQVNLIPVKYFPMSKLDFRGHPLFHDLEHKTLQQLYCTVEDTTYPIRSQQIAINLTSYLCVHSRLNTLINECGWRSPSDSMIVDVARAPISLRTECDICHSIQSHHYIPQWGNRGLSDYRVCWQLVAASAVEQRDLQTTHSSSDSRHSRSSSTKDRLVRSR